MLFRSCGRPAWAATARRPRRCADCGESVFAPGSPADLNSLGRLLPKDGPGVAELLGLERLCPFGSLG